MKESMCGANAHWYFSLVAPLGYHPIWKQMNDDIKFTELGASFCLSCLLQLL
jgi:hypothetical protein